MIGARPALPRAALLGVAACAAIAVGATAWYVAGVLGPIIGLFFGGWLIACALEPCVDGILHVTRAHRPGAVLATYVLAVLLLVSAGVLLGPAIAQQVENSVFSVPPHMEAAARDLSQVEAAANGWLADHRIPLQLDVESQVRAQHLDAIAAQAVTVGSGVLGALGSFGLMLLLSLFFLVDGPNLAERTAHAFGSRFVDDVRFVQTSVHAAAGCAGAAGLERCWSAFDEPSIRLATARVAFWRIRRWPARRTLGRRLWCTRAGCATGVLRVLSTTSLSIYLSRRGEPCPRFGSRS